MQNNIKHIETYDSSFGINEQLPRTFLVSFKEIKSEDKPNVEVWVDGKRMGDIINDNSYENDFYRYHDVFHYTFATMLGWSPCTRAMMKRKRKSNTLIDEIEDGARATITEEAISLMIFNEAKRKHFFDKSKRVKKSLLKIIKEMTEPFEVRSRTEKEWEVAIMKGYEIFRKLVKNNGGQVHFNMDKKTADYLFLPN